MTAGIKYLIKASLKTSNVNKKISQVINATSGFEIISIQDARQSDLLIYELGENFEKDMEIIESILASGNTKEVFLTADSADTRILMQAMRIGVKEFFSQPIDSDEIVRALERFKARQLRTVAGLPRKNGKVICVLGSKGGVGTTTIAVNLAVAIAQNKDRNAVALLDMNTLFGEIPLFLEMAPKFHWGEITKNIDRLDKTFLANILSNHKSGVHVLPSPSYLNGHVRPTPEIMSQLLNLMRQTFDHIIVDAGQSTDDTSLKILEMSNTLLLVTILSLPCLANTNKLLKSFRDFGYMQAENIKVVLNRNMKKGEISLKDAEAGIGRKLFWTIPNDFRVTMTAINNGKPLQEIAPNAQVTKSIRDLANSLSIAKKKAPKKKWRIFKR
jgi:pilus assembly protein CpaE